MDWLKSIWNKHLFGKDIPWANIKHQADGSITISDFNHAFVKSVTEKLPSELIENKFDDEIVVFADLLSGSPFNTAVMEALENEKIQVVYGTNLGMLIECIMMRNMGSSAIEIANKACEVGQTQIGKFEKQLESDDDSSDEEW